MKSTTLLSAMSAISDFLRPHSFLQSFHIFLKVSLLRNLPIGFIIQASFLTFSPGIENEGAISARRSISLPIAQITSPIIPKKKPRIYSSNGLPFVSSPGTSVIITVSTSIFAFFGSKVTVLIVGGQPPIAPQDIS